VHKWAQTRKITHKNERKRKMKATTTKSITLAVSEQECKDLLVAIAESMRVLRGLIASTPPEAEMSYQAQLDRLDSMYSEIWNVL
jgi:hypothetical protein